tara:strand:- start:109 stop:294 length:186 start_codon:yes stop_codon:yes gene_type:complete
MYEQLTQECKQCGCVMMEILDYAETPAQEHPKAIRAGWLCALCSNWEAAILRERVTKEKQS